MSLSEYLIPGDRIKEAEGEPSEEELRAISGLGSDKEERPPKVTEVNALVPPGKRANSHRPPCIEDGGASRCAWLTVHLPLTAQIVSVELAMKFPEHTNWTLCRENADTSLGWSWFGPVEKITSSVNKILRVQFKNWVHNGSRQIRMRVTYYE